MTKYLFIILFHMLLNIKGLRQALGMESPCGFGLCKEVYKGVLHTSYLIFV